MIKSRHVHNLMRDFFFELIETVMEINPLGGNLLTVTDIVFFLWNRHGRRILIFFTQRPILTSVVLLTLHDTLLTTRGRRGFIVFLFFVMSSNVGDTL